MNRLFYILKNGYSKSFFIAFIIAFCVLLPYTILDNGILLLTNDFQTQQIPFYMLTNDAIKNGETISWITGLGTSLLGSYSFYNLGSPFFWLVYFVPSFLLPYMMFPLLCLKFGVAALTSYGWLKRYIKNDSVRIFTSLLYAFSGFMIFNMFYNHFLDVVALFPLMLIALDELCENKRKGFFALTVTISLLTNYVFFVGEVVFIILYYTIKCITKSYKFSFKQFMQIALEAVLGLAGGAVMFTAVMFIMGNPRSGDKIDLVQMFVYNSEQYINIISGILFPADSPHIDPFYAKNGATRWQSAYTFLPLISLCGVIAYIKKNKKSFISIVLITSVLFMLIPVLNSAFNLFTSVYYARWFYMPILLAALATGIVFDNINENREEIKTGRISVIILSCSFAVIFLICRFIKSGFSLDFIDSVMLTAGFLALVLCGMFILSYIMQKQDSDIPKAMLRAVAGSCAVLLTIPALTYFGANAESNEDYKKNFVYNRDLFDDLKDDRFFRVDTSNLFHNASMWWELPSIELFNSNISSGEFEFYNQIGYNRTVYTALPDSLYPLRSFFSVKYLIGNKDMNDFLSNKTEKLPFGFFEIDNRLDYKLYQNENYIPMGFTYDYYLSKDEFSKLNSMVTRSQALLKAIILTDDQIKKYDYIRSASQSYTFQSFSTTQFEEDCKKLDENGCTTFETTKNGFNATITMKNKNLVFFTVPYEKGYTAKVNGKTVEIEKVDYGFMAVECPKGYCNIEFIYEPYGYNIMIWISGLAVAAELIIIILSKNKAKK